MNHTEICTGTSAKSLNLILSPINSTGMRQKVGLVLDFGNPTASDQQLGSFKIIETHNRTEMAIFCREGENSCR